jgi:hypothetical protein
MWAKIKIFIFGLVYENNEPSLTRCIVALAFLVFVAGTIVDIIMAYYGKTWQSYQTFATVTGGGSIGAKLTDKVTSTIVNGVWNSSSGETPKVVKNPAPTTAKP